MPRHFTLKIDLMDYHTKDARNRQKSSEDFLKEYYFKSQPTYFPANQQKSIWGFSEFESPRKKTEIFQ